MEYERLAGLYDPIEGDLSTTYEREARYYEKYKNVQEGVNTDWLAQPVRNAFSHTHSLLVEGVALNLESGVVSFFNAKGEPLLSENGKPEFTDFNDAGTKTFTVKQTFLLDKDEPLYGLGILQNGKMSQRNQTKRLVQGNV